jgi:hypothetical protein
MERRVCEAIQSRALIRFDYKGAERVAEVYAHGFNSSKVEAIRAFQVAGDSNASVPVGWKFFLVSEMRNLVVLPDAAAKGRYQQGEASHDLVIIHCAVPSEPPTS